MPEDSQNSPTPDEPFEPRFTREFLRQTGRVDSVRLHTVVAEILGAPYEARRSKRLRWELAGLRSARYDKGRRIIFKICEECRRRGDQKRNPLGCCSEENSPERIVTFIAFTNYHRG